MAENLKIVLDESSHLSYNSPCQHDGLSPNGKATDSDSVIFKVRILVAQLEKEHKALENPCFGFLFCCCDFLRKECENQNFLLQEKYVRFFLEI